MTDKKTPHAPASPPARSTHAPLDIFALSWPIFVETLLMTMLSTLGLWMASQVSVGAVAVFGLAAQLRGIFDRMFRVVGIGTSVVVTQHRGAGDVEGAREVAKAGVSAAFWMGLVVMLIVSLLPGPVLRLLQLPAELFDIAIPFFTLVGVSLLADSLTITMFSVLRAFTFTKDSMRLVLIMNTTQVCLSVPLVFGLWGLPELGLMGLGWGIVLARVLVLVLLAFMWARRIGTHLRLRELLLPARGPLAPILHIGLPSAGEKVAFRVCFMMTVAMAASLGTDALATHAYAWQIVALVNLVMIALGAGAEIIVGHDVGAGQLRRAHFVQTRALRWGLATTLVATILAYFIAPGVVQSLSGNPQVVALLVSVMLLEIVLEPARCVNTIITGGLRAAGDVRFPVKVSVLSNIVFGAGLAWLLGIHLGYGLPGIWLGYVADEWARALAMAARWYGLGWTPFARRARRRILRRLAAA